VETMDGPSVLRAVQGGGRQTLWSCLLQRSSGRTYTPPKTPRKAPGAVKG
jgi:hypothetical protein